MFPQNHEYLLTEKKKEKRKVITLRNCEATSQYSKIPLRGYIGRLGVGTKPIQKNKHINREEIDNI